MSRWKDFLQNAVKDENQVVQLRDWMGQLLGNGRRPEKILMLVGESASGKTVLLNLLSALVGEGSSMNILPKTVFDVVEIKGKRLIALEIEQTKKLTKISAQIRLLIGGDPLVGRKKHHLPETFTPVCAVACATNRVKPTGDLAFDARTLRIVMAPVAICDPGLFNDLLAEGTAIKEWALSPVKGENQ